MKGAAAALEVQLPPLDNGAPPASGLKTLSSPIHNAASPTIAQSSVKTPMSSISNSPSSVRINQNYDPHEVRKQLSPMQSTAPTTTAGRSDDGASSTNDLDLDNSEEADRKPLLDDTHSNSPISIANRKHTEYDNHDGSGIEKVALITNRN